ncbi:hypothetical protein ACHWQZ_G006906 [Mnemiopsis leidyi]
MTLPITSLPIPQSTVKYLSSRNIVHLSDVLKTFPWLDTYSYEDVEVQIEELNLPEVHRNLLTDFLINHFQKPVFQTSKTVKQSIPIITFCSSLDTLLCGGILPNEIVEFLGEPSSGTSQLCMQLAVDCSIPQMFGGRACKSLLIDCNGDICKIRLKQMATAALGHLNLIASNAEEKAVSSKLTADDLLSKVNTARCTNYTQLIALINAVSNDCCYGAIIIDALATHFRHEFEDMRQRTNILAELSNKLHKLCIDFPVSLVIVNQVRMDGEGSIQPCLGESWSHTATRRVFLRRVSSDIYSATIMKGKRSGESANFRISSRGIRDCPS